MNERDKQIIDQFMKSRGWTLLANEDGPDGYCAIEDDDRFKAKGEACGSVARWILDKVLSDYYQRLQDLEEYN